MTTEPTLDRFGNLCFRWFSSGAQIHGTLYVEHAHRCAQAIRTRRAGEAVGRVTFAAPKAAKPEVKPLPFRLERVG